MKEKINERKGITLIALVITIIVLLILAGVTIATLTGDNGILNNAQIAKESTEIAKFKEAAQLAYMEAYAENAQNGSYTVSMADMLGKLIVDHPEYNEPEKITDGTQGSILSIKAMLRATEVNQTNPVILGKEGTEVIEVVPTTSEGEGGTKYVELDGKYYEIMLNNGEVTLGEGLREKPTGTNKLEIEKGTGLTNVTATEGSNLKITIQAGSTLDSGDITLKYGGKTTIVKIEVKEKYTVTVVSEDSTNKGTVEVMPSNGDNKYAEGSTISLKATAKSGYQLEGWYNGEAKLSEANPYSYTVGTSDITITAKFKEAKLYGAQVQLNGENDITVKTVGTTNYTIKDNWKLFYIDDASNGYVHLIYGDYYPVDVQTDPDTGSTNTINLTPNSSYPWGVNSKYLRLNLLKYLKNNASYEEANLDSVGAAGSYESWINLASALTGTGKALAGKTITVQGAPNITMWKDSWKEQGYTELVLNSSGNTATGYKIEKKVASGTQSYGDYVSLSSESGYSDTLYFPYKNNTAENGNANKADGYWLASPGGGDANYVCLVHRNGHVGCIYDYNDVYLCARPVVSILKSDFQTLFPSVSITK